MPSLSNKAPPTAIHPSPLMPSYLENLHVVTEVKSKILHLKKKKKKTPARPIATLELCVCGCVCTRVKAREMDAGGG